MFHLDQTTWIRSLYHLDFHPNHKGSFFFEQHINILHHLCNLFCPFIHERYKRQVTSNDCLWDKEDRPHPGPTHVYEPQLREEGAERGVYVCTRHAAQ